jgi:hypothetical protein
MFRSLLGSSSGIRIKLRTAQTKPKNILTYQKYIKSIKDDQLTVGNFVVDPWSIYCRLFVYVWMDEAVGCKGIHIHFLLPATF